MFAGLGDPIYLTDATGKMRDVNDEACRVLGYGRDELLALTIEDVDADYDDTARLLNFLGGLVPGGSQLLQTRHRRKNGTTYPVEVRVTLIDIGGEPLVLGIARDLTEKDERLALLGARMNLRDLAVDPDIDIPRLLDATLDLAERLTRSDSAAYWCLSDEGAIETVAQTECKRTRGLVWADADDAPWRDVAMGDTVLRDEDEPHRQLVVAVVRGGRCVAVLAVANKPERYARTEIDLLESLADESWDALERKRMQLALAFSEQRHRFVVTTSPDAFWHLDGEGRLLDVNEACTRMTGYPREELIGMHVSEIESVETAPEIAAHIEKITRQGADRFETKHRRKDGTIIDVEVATVHAAPLGDTYFVFVRDITQRKRLEAQRVELARQLQLAQRMEALGTLAGGIAHDFNNILCGLQAFLDLAQSDLHEPELLAEDLREMKVATDRASALVGRILTFSQRREEKRAPTSLPKLIDEVMQLLRASLPANVEIGATLDRQDVHVEADANQLHQVLMNLGTNASQALRPKGGRLWISLEYAVVDEDVAATVPHLSARDYAVITVEDDGPGMDAHTRERAFEPYFTTKSPETGTGLGLSMVHNIVRSHGGAIRLDSAPAKGTRVIVYLPRARESATPEVEPAAPTNPEGTERLLVVDDEIHIRKALMRGLKRLGYAVTVAGSAEEALETMRVDPSRFDALATDYTMPGLSGLELARAARELRPQLPVVLFSGLAASGIGQLNEPFARLAKPYTAVDLALALRRLLA